MFKQKQFLAVVEKKRLSSVVLIVIMLFLPQVAFGITIREYGGPYGDTFNNPYTAGMSCPSGFTSIQIVFIEDNRVWECYKSTSVTSSDFSYSLDDLADVTISSVIQGEVLMKGSGNWVNFATSSGGTSFSTTTVNNNFYAVSTTTDDTVLVNNPTFDMFSLLILFILMMFFVVWWFKKR